MDFRTGKEEKVKSKNKDKKLVVIKLKILNEKGETRKKERKSFC
jgi:hypothetical protein